VRALPVGTLLGSALPIGLMTTTLRHTHLTRQTRTGCERGEIRRPTCLPDGTTGGEPAGCTRYPHRQAGEQPLGEQPNPASSYRHPPTVANSHRMQLAAEASAELSTNIYLHAGHGLADDLRASSPKVSVKASDQRKRGMTRIRRKSAVRHILAGHGPWAGDHCSGAVTRRTLTLSGVSPVTRTNHPQRPASTQVMAGFRRIPAVPVFSPLMLLPARAQDFGH
jgi:hypothetical protein